MRQTRFWLITFCVLSLITISSWRPVAAQDQKTQDIDLMSVLSSDIIALRDEGHYDDAISLAEFILKLCQGRPGENRSCVADALHGLASLYVAKGDYARAEPFYLRSLTLREQVFGDEHPRVAFSLDGLGTLYWLKGDYKLAESQHQRALRIREKALGVENPLVAESLNRLAAVYMDWGYYTRAEPLLRRAMAIQEKKLGTQHPDFAGTLNNLAVLCEHQGDYKCAEINYLRALEIEEKSPGAENSRIAYTLSNLGVLYERKGDYVRAEPLLRRAVEINEKVSGAAHPDLATSLNNLASLYMSKGDDNRAERLYLRALEIEEKALGTKHPIVALVLDNLATTYTHKGDYERAEPLYLRALEIREQVLGAEHPKVATSLNNLALMYSDKGEYTRALPLLFRALDITKKAFGTDNDDFAISLNNLASLYQTAGYYKPAAELYQRALEIHEKELGPEHPYVATVLSNLAVLHGLEGDNGHAFTSVRRGSEIEEKNITLILTTGSQQQKQSYLDTISIRTSFVVSLHLSSLSRSDEAARLALTVILQRKGRGLDAMSDHIAALRRRANPGDQKLLDQLADTLSHLATLQLSNVVKLTPEARRAETLRLEAEQEQLEDNISRRSAEFRAVTRPITLDAVRQAIPPDAALVELFVYAPFNPKATAAEPHYANPRYVVYVLRRDETVPQWVELGDAASINALVEKLRAALRDPKRDDFKRLARTLDERVMRLVRKLLGPTKRIFLSPDGALNLIPFAALLDENGQYLVENYSVSYLTSGRDLLRLQGAGESREPPKVFADPMYDLTVTGQQPTTSPQTNSQATPDINSQRSKDLIVQPYGPLPGTAAEAAALNKIFPDATLLTQGQATEAALKKVNRPRLLHIATHGFFMTDQPQSSAASQARAFGFDLGRDAMPPAIAGRENPLLRSGLILAGVKQQASGPGEDGVLTALEVAGLDLWGTKLVVLSACETGLGEVKNGEGVYGLRRALVLAGSETQVISLWKVSDAGTRDLMVAYYTRLQQGESRTEALRQVQLAMLKGKLLPSLKTPSNKEKGKRETGEMADEVKTKDYRHPYYWASFIPSGNWRNLAGQER
jgi:CHAT domain-containing protein/Tfp pilus assembly protein PilF